MEKHLPISSAKKQKQNKFGKLPFHCTSQHVHQHLCTHTLCDADKKPTLNELIVLKYDEEGETKRVRILNEASHKWKDSAGLICDDTNKNNTLEQQHPGRPNDCLRQALIDNFLNVKPGGYSQDWNGLIELLKDVDMEALAEKVKRALTSPTST